MSTYNEILDIIRKSHMPDKKVRRALESHDGSVVSGWKSGVYTYACELVRDLLESHGLKHSDNASAEVLNEKNLLCGASDWSQYSYGGCSLIYDVDIARRLCTAKAFARSDEGRKNPNGKENWLDVQARALADAARLLLRSV